MEGEMERILKQTSVRGKTLSARGPVDPTQPGAIVDVITPEEMAQSLANGVMSGGVAPKVVKPAAEVEKQFGLAPGTLTENVGPDHITEARHEV